MFIKKKDQYSDASTTNNSGYSYQQTKSSASKRSFDDIDFEGKSYSLNDLIHKMHVNPDAYGSITYQIQLAQSESNDDVTDVDTKFFFCLQIVDHMMMNDKQCKMIQFIDISKTVQYDEAV